MTSHSVRYSVRYSFRCGVVAGAVFAVISLAGCELTSSDDNGAGEGAVIVANQGNFSDGNGSITVYDPEGEEAATFASGLGSIIQSLLVVDEIVLVAANSGNRIDVFDAVSGSRVAQIDSVGSPRYMDRVSESVIAVTNQFENSLSIVNIDSSRVVATVAVGSNPEGVLVRGGVAYVANHGFGAGNTVSVVDLASRSVSRTIAVDCDGPRFTFLDAQGELFVVCTGQTLYDAEFNVIGMTNGAVVIVDPVSGAETGRIAIDGMIATPGPGQDAYYSAPSRRLFVVKDRESIVIIDTDTNARVGHIGPLDGDPVGGVAFRETDGRLYVARVPGFTTAGSVTLVSTDGSAAGEFSAGVAPSHIDFVEP